MKIQILHRFTAAVLFEQDAEDNSMKLTLQLAVKNKVDLSGAYLSGAYLSGAYLSGANLSDANLLPIKADFIEVISQAPREVPALIDALKAGRVDGSTYSGECSCLVGTIARAQGCDVDSPQFNIKKDSSQPIERFFMDIRKGDTPETNPASKLALEWAEVWLKTQHEAFAA